MSNLNPHSLSFVEEVNTFLNHVFSFPQTKSKLSLRARLKADWRKTLKEHVNFEQCGIQALGAMSRTEVAGVLKTVAGQVAAGRIPRVNFELETEAVLPPGATSQIAPKGTTIRVKKASSTT